MKRVIVFGVLFITLAVFSSCKKEIIEPHTCGEVSDKDNRVTSKSIVTTDSGTTVGGVNVPTGGMGEDITDPNDDDYTRRPKKKG
jgi:hypothetical protein